MGRTGTGWALAALVVMVGCTTACSSTVESGSSGSGTAPPPTAAPRRPPPVAANPTFRSGACPTGSQIESIAGARCGTVTVPLHHRTPTDRSVTLAVAVLPATSGAAAPDPVVFLS